MGREIFTTKKGVQYLLSKYLTIDDIVELKRDNDGFHPEEFKTNIIDRIHQRAGSSFIPEQYIFDLVDDAINEIGRDERSFKFKTINKSTNARTLKNGREVWFDKRGLARDINNGRIIAKKELI